MPPEPPPPYDRTQEEHDDYAEKQLDRFFIIACVVFAALITGCVLMTIFVGHE